MLRANPPRRRANTTACVTPGSHRGHTLPKLNGPSLQMEPFPPTPPPQPPLLMTLAPFPSETTPPLPCTFSPPPLHPVSQPRPCRHLTSTCLVPFPVSLETPPPPPQPTCPDGQCSNFSKASARGPRPKGGACGSWVYVSVYAC